MPLRKKHAQVRLPMENHVIWGRRKSGKADTAQGGGEKQRWLRNLSSNERTLRSNTLRRVDFAGTKTH